MIFEIDNIELDFKGKLILSGIYIKAETGSITGILGGNGTGKSSLLSVIFGNLQPHHKLIRINQHAYLKPLFTSGLVKYLPQRTILPLELPMKQIFALYKVDWANFILDFPEFAKHIKDKPRHLSGGQVRVIETFLIVKSPADLLLLDEPFTHLSPVYIEKFKKFLEEEKKRKAIIMTDHMYRHIIDVTDDLYLLKNGCSKYINDYIELEDYHYLNPSTL